jgi:hypothetical protein
MQAKRKVSIYMYFILHKDKKLSYSTVHEFVSFQFSLPTRECVTRYLWILYIF